jgi:hypothetical protein
VPLGIIEHMARRDYACCGIRKVDKKTDGARSDLNEVFTAGLGAGNSL